MDPLILLMVFQVILLTVICVGGGLFFFFTSTRRKTTLKETTEKVGKMIMTPKGLFQAEEGRKRPVVNDDEKLWEREQ